MIYQPQYFMYLYIAEKPSTMRAVKDAYEKSGKPLGEIRFFPLAGHVCRYQEPKEYSQWSGPWKDIQLPMIPQDFIVLDSNEKLMNELRDLLKEKYEAIIVGTDSDVEGNGIYALIEKRLGLENFPTYRFFETDLTTEGIMKSFRNLTDFHTNPRDIGMTNAFWVRSQFDWLVGFNMTVGYTTKSGMLMRIGRVKAPTLKLIYDNCNAIDNFEEKRSYQPAIQTADFSAFLVDENRKDRAFPDQNEAQAFVDKLGNTAIVKNVEKKKQSTPPPQFYKLTDLQVDAGKKFGYSPARSLEILQSLYEKKIMSYPRTDGRHISTEKSADFDKLLEAVKAIGLQVEVTAEDKERVRKDKRFVNDEEVKKSSHDALLPTGKIPDLAALSEEEQNILSMVYRRFLAAFMKPVKRELTYYLLNVDGESFLAKGAVIIDRGFADVLGENIKETVLPDLREGQEVAVTQKELRQIVTKPPARFTQATLIGAMENIQKYMSQGEYKDVMKAVKGIGQPSSRAAIIQDLLKSGYMEEKGKTLHITSLGKSYVENLQGLSILDPELTAEWEVHMQNVREQKEDVASVRSMMEQYVKDSIEEISRRELHNSTDLSCPVCGSPLKKTSFGYACDHDQFTIGTKICGKTLTENQIKTLLGKGATPMISGFVSKAGKKFDAKLVLKDGKVSFDFDNTVSLTCPLCGKPMKKTKFGYGCSGYPDCQFSVGTTICGKTLTENQVKTLISKGATPVISGFTSKAGKKFDAKLILKDGKVSFDFS